MNGINAVQKPNAGLRTGRLIWNLARDDFRQKFAGSYLGIFWAFVQPVVITLVYWFVFQKALHAGTQAAREGIEVPYVLWLIAGLVPWFYFSEAVNTGAHVLLEYSFLVKKVVFNIRILPAVRILSSLFVHVFFVAFMLFLYAVSGLRPTLYAIQLVYYSFCMLALCLGLCYLTGSVSVFFRDLTQVINILLQIGIWFTPIMWNIQAMNFSKPLMALLRLNPMFYVVQGYRDALIGHVWFWQRPGQTILFWAVTVVIWILGQTVFNRLRPHLADVI